MSNEQFKQQLAILKSLATHQIEKQDYVQLVSRWNEYQTALDAIIKMAKNMRGVELEKNITSNVRSLDDVPDSFFNVALPALLAILPSGYGGLELDQFFKLSPPIMEFTIGLSIIGVALARYFILRHVRSKQPQIFKISCKPVLHINELEYVHYIIKGVPEQKKDPEIYLPELAIEVPREWLAQESSRRVMAQLSDIKLPDFGKKEDSI